MCVCVWGGVLEAWMSRARAVPSATRLRQCYCGQPDGPQLCVQHCSAARRGAARRAHLLGREVPWMAAWGAR
mgnify:CR=1 FL=1